MGLIEEVAAMQRPFWKTDKDTEWDAKSSYSSPTMVMYGVTFGKENNGL